MMHRFLTLLIVALGILGAGPATSAPLRLINTLPEFDRVAAKVSRLPEHRRVAAFERLAAPIADGFYARSRLPENYDRRITMGLADFKLRRKEILTTAKDFEGAFRRAIPKFEQTFGPLESPRPIYVVDSFGEMDGGTRDLPHGSTLLFGADVIAKIHPSDTMEAFLDHELFHLWHEPRFKCDPAWCSLWEEGMATYVAAAMNADAGDNALMLDQPAPIRPTVDKDRAAAVCAAMPIMPSTDEKDYAKLFFGNSHVEGFPARMGYYLGYLVVADLAKSRSLKELAGLSPEEAEPLVRQSLRAMAPACASQWN
jgi:hypothetical protein